MATKPRPHRKNPVFTEFRRAKLLRKRIPLAESASGLAVLLFLILAAGWVHAKRDDFDPGERDLDLALLEAKEGPEDLWENPRRFWRDPSLGPAAGPAADLGPFPATMLATGWRSGRLQSFSPETLYEKINGQAEQYLKFGFRELTVLPLEHPGSGASLDLYLYEQGSPAEALGLYAEQRGDKPSSSFGPVSYTETTAGAFGSAGPFVFHLVGAPDGPALHAQTQSALGAIAGIAGEVVLEAPQRLLADGLGLGLDAVGFTPVNAFQLSFAERFWFGSLAASPTTRAFAHEAADAAAAEELLERLVAAQEEELELLGRDDGWVSLKHRFLGTHYGLAVEGAMLVGVEDHPERAGARAVLERLVGAARHPGVAQEGLSLASAPAADAGTEGDDDEGYGVEQ